MNYRNLFLTVLGSPRPRDQHGRFLMGTFFLVQSWHLSLHPHVVEGVRWYHGATFMKALTLL